MNESSYWAKRVAPRKEDTGTMSEHEHAFSPRRPGNVEYCNVCRKMPQQALAAANARITELERERDQYAADNARLREALGAIVEAWYRPQTNCTPYIDAAESTLKATPADALAEQIARQIRAEREAYERGWQHGNSERSLAELDRAHSNHKSVTASDAPQPPEPTTAPVTEYERRIGSYCSASQRVDKATHSWRFDGDDPYVICDWCGEMRDAVSGILIPQAVGGLSKRTIDTVLAERDELRDYALWLTKQVIGWITIDGERIAVIMPSRGSEDVPAEYYVPLRRLEAGYYD